MAPPTVARDLLDGSGANVIAPSDAARICAWRSVSTMPGSTTAVDPSYDSTRFMYREKSRTTPSPIALPASEVPPPRPTTGIPAAPHARTTAATSSAVRGKTTP